MQFSDEQLSLSSLEGLEHSPHFSFHAESNGVKIDVEPTYVYEESGEDDLGEDRGHVWMYHIRIENLTHETLQLKSRYWRIIAGNGLVEEVHGSGVAGEHPVLHPGESYEYASATALAVPSGFMQGCYDMEKPNGALIQVDIPAFSLDVPGMPPVLN